MELIRKSDALPAVLHNTGDAAIKPVDAVPVVRCRECKHYHDEDDPAYCDELCTIHIEKTDGCLRGIKRGAIPYLRAADGERKDGEHEER